ncbi:hypothetical protein ACFO0D_05440 [Deinococcus hohokamensis]|uniref:DNA primase/polymerase bifunctional N-terminal domain-containing protein n=1 Tax=Deinococcus hohokamensis TaxID=309883 RepID=A0ABV9I7V9_9DEIO
MGLAITARIRLTAIDLDDCLDDAGEVTAPAQAVLTTFLGAYVERSPSGRGLHVLVRGSCPSGWRRQPSVEIIDHGFLTVTGHGFPFPHSRLAYDEGDLRAWHAAHAPQRVSESSRLGRPNSPPGEWFTRACQARNGAKFRALWNGHLAGCPTASEGDLQLLLLILYWWPEASDTELIWALLDSGRYRPKLCQEQYIERTIAAVRRLQAPREHDQSLSD